jgi:cytochrome c peroxidase
MRQTPMLAGRDVAHTAPYGWSGEYRTLEDYIQFTITQRMQGDGLPKKDLAALARYVREGLRPVTRPAVAHRDDVRRGRIVFNADSTGCASCHGAADAFTDGATHDVGSMSEHERLAWLLSADAFGPGLGLRGTPSRQLQLIRLLGKPKPPQLDRQFDGLINPTNSLPGVLGKRPTLVMPASLMRYDTPSLLGLGLSAPYLHDGSAKSIDDVFVRLGDHMGTVSTLTLRERDDLAAYLRTL